MEHGTWSLAVDRGSYTVIPTAQWETQFGTGYELPPGTSAQDASKDIYPRIYWKHASGTLSNGQELDYILTNTKAKDLAYDTHKAASRNGVYEVSVTVKDWAPNEPDGVHAVSATRTCVLCNKPVITGIETDDPAGTTGGIIQDSGLPGGVIRIKGANLLAPLALHEGETRIPEVFVTGSFNSVHRDLDYSVPVRIYRVDGGATLPPITLDLGLHDGPRMGADGRYVVAYTWASWEANPDLVVVDAATGGRTTVVRGITWEQHLIGVSRNLGGDPPPVLLMIP